MTLGELIERLEEMQEVYGEDCEVRLMTQQQWPFENDIRGVTVSDEIPSEEPDEDEDGEEFNETICYIVEGGQICYGNKNAWNVAY